MSTRPECVFTRDYVDSNRINLQHYIWVELFGYRIHPQIPVSLPNLRVADVGTGTAAWITDLSPHLPSAQLDGLDVSFDAAPPREWLPPNVTLRSFDVKGDVPADLLGCYDVVHIRNFAFVLLDEELAQALSNLAKLLKPGGHLQWGE
ncbi:hypothetical protein INS49_013623 [Diaporthe citri]|uniref:uncharacterized protein n=1 Tax=Diaporthe citri TaxID=83186 RepID=UPI001C7E7518|nr:uncharacterized protein INS49_013623 [Diaporthe citri]KAG6357744.1 hypothetical protein INS49_013623 [Diaporthe citri]